MAKLHHIDITLHCSECGPVVHPFNPSQPVTARVTGDDLSQTEGADREVWHQAKHAWDDHLLDHRVGGR